MSQRAVPSNIAQPLLPEGVRKVRRWRIRFGCSAFSSATLVAASFAAVASGPPEPPLLAATSALSVAPRNPARDPPAPPAGDQRGEDEGGEGERRRRGASHASASIFAASSKSAAVSPPSAWVEIVPVTVAQEFATSGWWPIASAGSTKESTKRTEPTKSPRSNDLAIASPRRSQPSRSASIASISSLPSSAIPHQPNRRRTRILLHRLRSQDDLQRFAAVEQRVGLGGLVELHVVGDQRRRVELGALQQRHDRIDGGDHIGLAE